MFHGQTFKRYNYRRYAHRTPYKRKRENNVNNKVTMSPIVSTGVLKNLLSFSSATMCYIVIPFEQGLTTYRFDSLVVITTCVPQHARQQNVGWTSN